MKSGLIIFIIVLVVILGFVFLRGDSEVTDEGLESEATVPAPAPAPGAGTEINVNTEGTVNTYQAPVKEFTITASNFSFTPATLNVNEGDRVKITFVNSEGFHDFRIDEFGVATKQFNAPGTEVIEFTADKTGTFEYYCSVGSHRAMGMVGTLVVQ